MAYDPGALEAALSAAVGDSPCLIEELRGAFFASAKAHVGALTYALSVEEWRMAAIRLHGLAASFGAVRLMDVATEAAQSNRSDAAVLRKIERTLAALEV